MSDQIMKAVKEKKRLGPDLMKQFIGTLSKSIFAVCQKPGKKNLQYIARNIHVLYPATFSDVFCGDIIAGGYETLTRKLVIKFENMNRRDVFHTTKRRLNSSLAEDIDEINTRKIQKSDQYGCINWQLTNLPDGESEESLEAKQKKNDRDVFYTRI